MNFPYEAVAILKNKPAPGSSGHLSFNKGDPITVLSAEDEDGDWLRGTSGSSEGIFPAHLIQKASEHQETTPVAQQSQSNEGSPVKPTSLRDRIAMFNKPAASTSGPPPIRAKPAQFQRTKPSLPPPAAEPATEPIIVPSPEPSQYTTPVSLPPTSSAFSASDAKESIGKGGGSLKDRIAALQGLKVDANAPGRPTKPWKAAKQEDDSTAPEDGEALPITSEQVVKETSEEPEQLQSPVSEERAADVPAIPVNAPTSTPLAVPRRAGPPRRKQPSPSASLQSASSESTRVTQRPSLSEVEEPSSVQEEDVQPEASSQPDAPKEVEKEVEKPIEESSNVSAKPSTSAEDDFPEPDNNQTEEDPDTSHVDATSASRTALHEAEVDRGQDQMQTNAITDAEDAIQNDSESYEEVEAETSPVVQPPRSARPLPIPQEAQQDPIGDSEDDEARQEHDDPQTADQAEEDLAQSVGSVQSQMVPPSPTTRLPPVPGAQIARSGSLERPPIPVGRPPVPAPAHQSSFNEETKPKSKPQPLSLGDLGKSLSMSPPTFPRSPTSISRQGSLISPSSPTFKPPMPMSKPSMPPMSEKPITNEPEAEGAPHSAVVEEPEKQDDGDEEDEETARRQRLAARMAALGGQKVGVFPMMGRAPPPSVRKDSKPAEEVKSENESSEAPRPKGPFVPQGGFALPGITKPTVVRDEEAAVDADDGGGAADNRRSIELEELSERPTDSPDQVEETRSEKSQSPAIHSAMETGTQAEEDIPRSPVSRPSRPLPPSIDTHAIRGTTVPQPPRSPSSPRVPTRPEKGHVRQTSLTRDDSVSDRRSISTRAESIIDDSSEPRQDSAQASEEGHNDNASRTLPSDKGLPNVPSATENRTSLDLQAISERYGTAIFAKARAKVKEGARFSSDNPSLAFTTSILSGVEGIQSPSPSYEYGFPILSLTAGQQPTIQGRVQLGDILVVHHGKFKGKLGGSILLGSQSSPHVGIVADELDLRKMKIKCFEANKEGKIEQVSHQLDQMKEGAAFIFRVVPAVSS